MDSAAANISPHQQVQRALWIRDPMKPFTRVEFFLTGMTGNTHTDERLPWSDQYISEIPEDVNESFFL
jgi:hypothetical protein